MSIIKSKIAQTLVRKNGKWVRDDHFFDEPSSDTEEHNANESVSLKNIDEESTQHEEGETDEEINRMLASHAEELASIHQEISLARQHYQKMLKLRENKITLIVQEVDKLMLKKQRLLPNSEESHAGDREKKRVRDSEEAECLCDAELHDAGKCACHFAKKSK